MRKNLFLFVLAMLMAMPMMAADQTVKLDGFRIGTSTTVKYSDFYTKKETTAVGKSKNGKAKGKTTTNYWYRYKLSLPELKSGNVYLLSDAKTFKQTLVLDNANLSETSINFVSKDITIVVIGNCRLKQIIANQSNFKDVVVIYGGKLADTSASGGWLPEDRGNSLTISHYSSNGLAPIYINGDGQANIRLVDLKLETDASVALEAKKIDLGECNITGKYKNLFLHGTLINFDKCGIKATAYPNLHYSLKNNAFMNNGNEVKIEISNTQYERMNSLYLSANATNKVSIKNKAGQVCYEYLKIGSKDLAKVNLGDMKLFGDNQFYSSKTEKVAIGVGQNIDAQELIIPYKMLKSGKIYYIPSQKAIYFAGVNINSTSADQNRELFNTAASFVQANGTLMAYFYRTNTISYSGTIFAAKDCNLVACEGTGARLAATGSNWVIIATGNVMTNVPGTLKTTANNNSAVFGKGTFSLTGTNLTLEAPARSAIAGFAEIISTKCGMKATLAEAKTIKYDKTDKLWLKSKAAMTKIEFTAGSVYDNYLVDTRTRTISEGGHTVWPLVKGTFVNKKPQVAQ